MDKGKTLYVYGMRLRGFSPGCQPKQGIVEALEDAANRYHNLLVYDRKLTAEEARDYELDFIKTITEEELNNEFLHY